MCFSNDSIDSVQFVQEKSNKRLVQTSKQMQNNERKLVRGNNWFAPFPTNMVLEVVRQQSDPVAAWLVQRVPGQISPPCSAKFSPNNLLTEQPSSAKANSQLLKKKTNFLVGQNQLLPIYNMPQKMEQLVVSLLRNPHYISLRKQTVHQHIFLKLIQSGDHMSSCDASFFIIHGATRNGCKCPWNILNIKIFKIKMSWWWQHLTLLQMSVFHNWKWNKILQMLTQSLKNTMFSFINVMFIHFNFWWWCWFLTIYHEMS